MQPSIDLVATFHHTQLEEARHVVFMVSLFDANVCLFTAIAVQPFSFGLLWNSKWSTYLGHEKSMTHLGMRKWKKRKEIINT